MSSDKKNIGDLALALILVFLSGGLLIYVMTTFTARERVYPGFLFFALCCFAVVQVVRSVRHGKKSETAVDKDVSSAKKPDPIEFRLTMTVIGATVAYILCVHVLGFWAASLLFLFGLTVALGYRNLPVLLITEASIIVTVYLIFARLYIPVPTGMVWKIFTPN